MLVVRLSHLRDYQHTDPVPFGRRVDFSGRCQGKAKLSTPASHIVGKNSTRESIWVRGAMNRFDDALAVRGFVGALAALMFVACVAVQAAPTQKQLKECLSIDDMTKERLDCYDKLVSPEPKLTTRKTKSVLECRFVKEEDERLACFNGFTNGAKSSGFSKANGAVGKKGSPQD
jgi:hypothetical protein